MTLYRLNRFASRALAVTVATLAVAPGALAAGEGKPLIEGFSASRVGERSARLNALINPQGSATTYTFWVKYAPCQHGAGECPLGPQTESVAHGVLAAGAVAVHVRKRLTKLQHGCLYSVWVVAANSHGETESARESVQTSGREGLDCRR